MSGVTRGNLYDATTAITTSTNGTGLDMSDGTALTAVIVDIGTVTGTTPTLAIQIKESDDNVTFTAPPGTNVSPDGNAAGLFTTITAVGQYAICFQRTKRYLAAYWTVAGTNTPTFPANMDAFDQSKYTCNPNTGVSRSPSS